jgi:hypothetical protein
VCCASLERRLFGLDARTGKPLWVIQRRPAGGYNMSTGASGVMTKCAECVYIAAAITRFLG